MKKALALTLVAGAALTACAPDGDDPSTWSDGRQLNWIEDDPYYRELSHTSITPEGLREEGQRSCDSLEENFGGSYGRYIEAQEERLTEDPDFPTTRGKAPTEHDAVMSQYVGVNLECPEYAEDFYGWTDAEPQEA